MPFREHNRDDILDSLGEGVFTVDKDFRINFFNRAAEKITGIKREEVLGSFCKHVFRSDLCYSSCPIANVLESGKNIYDYESRIPCKNGERKPIKLNAAILRSNDDQQEPYGGIISFRDMSEFERIGERLEKETQFNGIIGHSKAMQSIFELIREVADSGAPVFIKGESGTGKEMVANALVKEGNRADKPFVKINCSVFPAHLLGSELFGHIKGAFTDAICDRKGRFEVADKGTLFLDEVAEMPLQMQIQLLRVLQEGAFERIGESVTRKVDVRVIAATNIDISKALAEGKFREDLYYRMNVIPIEVPPLRERQEDIIPLVNHFLKKFSMVYKKEISEFDHSCADKIMSYKWPGNVRELENAIEYAFVRTNSNTKITCDKLPDVVIAGQAKIKSFPVGTDLLDNEKIQLITILNRHSGNRTHAAKELGIGRTTLWRKLKKHGLLEESVS